MAWLILVLLAVVGAGVYIWTRRRSEKEIHLPPSYKGGRPGGGGGRVLPK